MPQIKVLKMFSTLLILLLILVAVAVLYWGIQQLTLPPNVKVVAVVVLAILALWFIARTVTGHPIVW